MSTLIYKICAEADWANAQLTGHFDGAPVDVADGFIHLSAAAQVRETAARHFVGQTGLVLVAILADALGPALKWEPSRGGDLFPHLYGPLATGLAAWVHPLPLGEDGAHIFGNDIP